MQAPALSPEVRGSTQSPVSWTLADLLSTYRFWALLFACALVQIASQGVTANISTLMRSTDAGFSTLSAFYSTIQFSMGFGALFAFFVAGRRGRLAIFVPLVLCALVALVPVFGPERVGHVGFLTMLGFFHGVVQGFFLLAPAIFLAGARSTKIDFAGAFAMIVVAALSLGKFGPSWGNSLLQKDPSGTTLFYGVIACWLLAALLVWPCRHIGFDDAPRPRHKPLEPTRRSALAVALCALVPVLVAMLVAVLFLGPWFFPIIFVALFSPSSYSMLGGTDITWPLVILVLGVLLSLIYVGWWLRRIHGELARLAPSQRLLTPWVAVPIGLIVPLGLPVLLMTLGDLLNDRAREQGKGKALSTFFLAFWSVVIPPVAMAMIQKAANNSYPQA